MSENTNRVRLSRPRRPRSSRPEIAEAEARHDRRDQRTSAPCKKHIKISIPQAEIDRQYNESVKTLRKESVVPGFRPGKAPRQLVVKRFHKQVSEQVKSTLLMSSLEQIDKDYELDPITQPQLDIAAIELPKDGPMNFEMDVEVRPAVRGARISRASS